MQNRVFEWGIEQPNFLYQERAKIALDGTTQPHYNLLAYLEKMNRAKPDSCI